MKTLRLILLAILASAITPAVALAQLTTEYTFDPADIGSLCGVAHHHDNNEVWLYGCNASDIGKYDLEGNLLEFIPMVGGFANDVDLEIAPEDLMLAGSFVPEGSLLIINGESSPTKIYAVDHVTGEIIDTLITEFGVGHVVGGAYHPYLDSFFLIQDNVPAGANANLIVEIDPMTGAILDSLPLAGFFDVNFGDIDISSFSGNLFLVSSIETSIAEYTPAGEFVQELPLPAGLSGQSGISLDCDNGEAWIVSSAANRITGFVCDNLNGTEEWVDDYGLSIYPNPTSSELHVEFDRIPKDGRAQIYNGQGKLLAEQSLGLSTRLGLDALANGQYVIVVKTESGLVTRSVFIKE